MIIKKIDIEEIKNKISGPDMTNCYIIGLAIKINEILDTINNHDVDLQLLNITKRDK